MARIGLCMIVKNEAHVIRRCLDSAKPLVDHVLISDTGSTDGTQDVVRAYLAEHELPGEVIQDAWRDFAHNRSAALRALRLRTDLDYCLMIDADEILVYEPGFDADRFKRDLTCDVYDIRCHYDAIVYLRPQLFSNRLDFRFRGVLHEFLEIPQVESRATVEGFFNRPLHDSARGRDPDTYRADAALLERALQEEADPFLIARYNFYLAQSYRDCGERQRALAAYLRRSTLGLWDEEVFISLLAAARLEASLGYGDAEVIQTYLAAYEALPRRAESLHDAARHCRLTGRYQQACMLARQGLAQPRPANGLFLEPWIYDYGLLDELSVSAYWAGHFQESFDSCLRLLHEGLVPASERPRILDNARFAIERLDRPELNDLLPTT